MAGCRLDGRSMRHFWSRVPSVHAHERKPAVASRYVSRGNRPERSSQTTLRRTPMARIKLPLLGLALVAILVLTVCATQSQPRAQSTAPSGAPQSYDALIHANASRMVEEGKQIFRFDTFGSEDFWGGKLRLHESIAGQKLGGVGAGVSPKAALSLGLKVDAEALPADLVAAIKAGKVNMDDPASTVALLKEIGRAHV